MPQPGFPLQAGHTQPTGLSRHPSKAAPVSPYLVSIPGQDWYHSNKTPVLGREGGREITLHISGPTVPVARLLSWLFKEQALPFGGLQLWYRLIAKQAND